MSAPKPKVPNTNWRGRHVPLCLLLSACHHHPTETWVDPQILVSPVSLLPYLPHLPSHHTHKLAIKHKRGFYYFTIFNFHWSTTYSDINWLILRNEQWQQPLLNSLHCKEIARTPRLHVSLLLHLLTFFSVKILEMYLSSRWGIDQKNTLQVLHRSLSVYYKSLKFLACIVIKTAIHANTWELQNPMEQIRAITP